MDIVRHLEPERPTVHPACPARSRRGRSSAAVLALLAPLLLSSCGEDAPVTPEAADLSVTPSSVTLVAGETVELVVEVLDTDGLPLDPGEVRARLSWSSDAPGVASVAGGRVTAVAPGVTTVRVVYPGLPEERVSVAVVPELEITTTSVPEGRVGATYSAALAATGGDGSLTWTVASGALPPGLSLESASGVIGGTPSAAGDFGFTVEVTSAGLADSRAFSIRIVSAGASPPPTVETTELASVIVGLPYEDDLVASGGDGSYAWTVVSGVLPPGLSLDGSTGAIAGTPTELGDYSFTVQVASDGRTASRALAIDVNGLSEPGDHSAIVIRPFDSKAADNSDRGTGSFPRKTGGSEGWDGIEYREDNLTIVAGRDPLSPGSAMRFRYPVGLANNSGPGVAQTQPLGSPRELYVRTAVRLGPDYWAGSVSNKLYFHRMEGGLPRGEPFVALHGGGAGGAGTFRLAANFQGTPDNGLGWFYASGAGTRIERERWYVLETLLVMNAGSGIADGIFRMWLDGELVLERTDVEYITASGAEAWGSLHVSPTFGGSGAPNPTEFHWELGHAHISGK